MNYTSIEITQYELLAQIIEHNTQQAHEQNDAGADPSEVAEVMHDLIPIFKSKSILCSSLERLAIAHRDEPEADLCRLCLAALQGAKNENI